MNDTQRISAEYLDEAGYPDGAGFLSENQAAPEAKTTIDLDRPRANIAFDLIRDDTRAQYLAVTGVEELGTITFAVFGSRIALIHTQVELDYRHQRIASELIWRVLEDVRARGESMTVVCPLVRAFIDGHPHYFDLVDSAHPGL